MAEYLKLPEVARRLDISEKTARRMVKGGKLPAVFIGNAYRVSEEDITTYLRNAQVDPKAPSRSSVELSFNDILEDERRGGATDADIVREYESITRRYRMAWRGALENLTEPWEERLRTGAFDRGMVEQFFTDVAAIAEGVSGALSASVAEGLTGRKYKAPPTRADIEEMEATGIGSAAARLLDVGDALYEAAAEKFAASDLEQLRRKRDAARRALERAA